VSRYVSAYTALRAAARHGWPVCITPAARCAPALCAPVCGVVTHGEWGEFTIDGVQVPGWIERIEHADPEDRERHGPLYVA
jgi:hypothetical protein